MKLNSSNPADVNGVANNSQMPSSLYDAKSGASAFDACARVLVAGEVIEVRYTKDTSPSQIGPHFAKLMSLEISKMYPHAGIKMEPW